MEIQQNNIVEKEKKVMNLGQIFGLNNTPFPIPPPPAFPLTIFNQIGVDNR